jgi:NTE family protein
VILAVCAETNPDVMDFGGDEIPTLFRAMTSLIDVPINRYSADSIWLMRLGAKMIRDKLRNKGRAENSPFTEDADVYFINASLSEIPDPDERAALMRIPTTLYLTDHQIERLLLAASRLIRNDPEFQRLTQDIESGR